MAPVMGLFAGRGCVVIYDRIPQVWRRRSSLHENSVSRIHYNEELMFFLFLIIQFCILYYLSRFSLKNDNRNINMIIPTNA